MTGPNENDDVETPEGRLITALNDLGFTDDQYLRLARSLEKLHLEHGGLSIVRYSPLPGSRLFHIDNYALIVMDRLYESFKQGDEAFSIHLLHSLIDMMEKAQ